MHKFIHNIGGPDYEWHCSNCDTTNMKEKHMTASGEVLCRKCMESY